MQESNTRYRIGIDEAGRGPLAGPVYVGIVKVPADYNFGNFVGLTDSKQMSESDRVEMFTNLQSGTEELTFDYRYSYAETVDTVGINKVIQQAINRGLKKFNAQNTRVFLDGGLKAPERFAQKTITKGDKKEPVISLASVVAKVARDNHMRRLDENYANFSFDKHKGYGTKKHKGNIKKHGKTDIHRKSFLGSKG
jgi:ribonuclease HII